MKHGRGLHRLVSKLLTNTSPINNTTYFLLYDLNVVDDVDDSDIVQSKKVYALVHPSTLLFRFMDTFMTSLFLL